MKRFRVFDIGKDSNYFDSEKNKSICKKVAEKCYLPANKLMLELIERHDKKFKVAYSISGTALEQFEEYSPDVIESFKKLAKTGCVEFLSETYYHSLAFMFSKKEFKEQVLLHKQKIESLFNVTPTVFRNTELIYNNDVADIASSFGYKGVLAEGADELMGWKSPNHVYRSCGDSKLPVLLKNYKLSDDIAFRFSNKSWDEWPLTADKFSNWMSGMKDSETVNLFMDYETFGEHQWKETGIFEFMNSLPEELFKIDGLNFKTPSEIIDTYTAVGDVDVKKTISWADVERDMSAWLGNPMQDNSVKELYALESVVKESGDSKLLDDWRKLTTSDHLYYMCTKWFADGDVHKYFNPYDTPYDGFINFMNVLNDFVWQLKERNINVSDVKVDVSKETESISN